MFVCGSIFFDAAPDGGWFMYPPLATEPSLSGIGADIWMLGLSFIEVSSIAAAVELIVGVLKCRPPGMRLNLMPLYAWYILVVAVMILFAFPPLIAGDVLFEMERLLDWPFFDRDARRRSAAVAAPVLDLRPSGGLHHLPAGDRACSRWSCRRSRAGICSAIPGSCSPPSAPGFLSFGLWVHHMFATGLPQHQPRLLLGRVGGGGDSDCGADLRVDRDDVGRHASSDRRRCCSARVRSRSS